MGPRHREEPVEGRLSDSLGNVKLSFQFDMTGRFTRLRHRHLRSLRLVAQPGSPAWLARDAESPGSHTNVNGLEAVFFAGENSAGDLVRVLRCSAA